MTKRKRFYLHDVAACIGVEVSRLRILCQYWEVAAHGVHEFEDVKGQRAWLSWAGVEKIALKNYPPHGTDRMDSDTRREFLDKVWEHRKGEKWLPT